MGGAVVEHQQETDYCPFMVAIKREILGLWRELCRTRYLVNEFGVRMPQLTCSEVVMISIMFTGVTAVRVLFPCLSSSMNHLHM